MTACLDTATLRTGLDMPDAALDEHLAICDDCRAVSRGLRDDAVSTGALLRPLEPEALPDVAATEAALHKVRSAAPVIADLAPAAPAPQRRAQWQARRWDAGLRVAAAVALVVVMAAGVVATPGGRSAAAAFLAAFRSERFAVVTVDPAELTDGFAALERFGPVRGVRGVRPERVDDLDAAAEVAGFQPATVPAASLPDSAGSTPTLLASPAHEVSLTLRRRRVPDMPANLDGTRLIVGVPAAVVQIYQGEGESEVPGLVVAEASQITARTEGGASLDEVRDYLLDTPGLPPSTVAQLRAIDDWRTTLPIFVPMGDVSWQDTTVAGSPAVAFGDESGLVAAVLWQRDGRIHGVGGALPASQTRALAEELGG